MCNLVTITFETVLKVNCAKRQNWDDNLNKVSRTDDIRHVPLRFYWSR